MVDFTKFREAQVWLDQQPAEIAISIASRAALRVLPLIMVYQRDRPAFGFYRNRALPAFHSGAVSWAAARFPAASTELRRAAKVAARNARVAFFDAGASNDAAYAAAYQAAFRAAHGVSDTSFNAYEDIPEAYADAHGAAGRAEANDAEVLQRLPSGPDEIPRIGSALACTPLWPESMPLWVRQSWTRLKKALLADNEDWQVWTDWYEDRLVGQTCDEELELARALLPGGLWRRGPRAVNQQIRRLIDEATKHRLPEEPSLPKQTSRAAIFELDARGVIGLAPPRPADRLADTDEVRDLYGEVREKLDDLLSLGRNMLGDRLYRLSEKFRSRMPEAASEAVERLVWSSGNTLRGILAAHDGVVDQPDPHPDTLERGAAERLRDVVGTFNQLAVADPALRERDANRPGPQEHQNSTSEINIVIELGTKAAADRAITTLQAGEELSENASTVKESRSGLFDRLAVELARDTHRNFFAGVVISVYRVVRNLPAFAQGKGGFVSKEYFSGIYKAAGNATAVAATSAVVGTYYLRWEIVDFVISHADQLRLYAAYAFEQSPGFKQMIDWLEGHVRDENKKDA